MKVELQDIQTEERKKLKKTKIVIMVVASVHPTKYATTVLLTVEANLANPKSPTTQSLLKTPIKQTLTYLQWATIPILHLKTVLLMHLLRKVNIKNSKNRKTSSLNLMHTDKVITTLVNL